MFNVSGRPLTELVPLSEFPGTVSSIDYVVRAHTADRVSDPTDLASPRSLFNVTLGTRGFEVFSAYPLERMACEQLGVVSVANLGLVDKMTGCAAIVKNAIHKQDNGQIRITTRLKALGVLGEYPVSVCYTCIVLTALIGIYISCLPCLVVERDFMITIFGTPVPLDSVAVVANNPCVLKVDVERAWKEMDLGARGKEVDVMAYFAAR